MAAVDLTHGRVSVYDRACDDETLVTGDSRDWPTDDAFRKMIATSWLEPFGDRQQEIVVIGVQMNRSQVEAALSSALLTDDELALGQSAWAAWPDPIAAAWVAPDEPSRPRSAPHHHHAPKLTGGAVASSLRDLATTHQHA